MVVNQLTQKQNILKDTMNSLEQQATREEKKCHQDMMTKTDNNIQKLSTELGKRKHRKLENISIPNSKRKARQQDTRTQKGESRLREQWKEKKQRKTTTVSNHCPSLQSPPANHPPALQPQNLLGMTLADLITGFQNQASLHPQVVAAAQCTPVSGQSPQLLHPGGKGGLGQPPMLPQPIQQGFGPQVQLQPQLHQITPTYCAPVSGQPQQLVHPGVKVGLGQPLQLPRIIQQDFGGSGRLPIQ
jgi:hypothetical protein